MINPVVTLFSSSPSCSSSLSFHGLIIDHLPTEVLSIILSNLDLSSLLQCFNVSKRWRKTSEPYLIESLKSTTLRLWFRQEGQYCRFVEFSFKGYNYLEERLIFERCSETAHCWFQSSGFVQRPRLQSISFLRSSTGMDDTDPKNYLDKRVALTIAQPGEKIISGTQHCFNKNYPWSFTYEIEQATSVRPSSSFDKTRELKVGRIVRPLVFECSPNFLNENRLGMNLIFRWFQSKFGENGTVKEWIHTKRRHHV